MTQISVKFETALVDIRMTRYEGKEPVPSHAGPAVIIRWTLEINGVVIKSDEARYAWETNLGRAYIRSDPPRELRAMYDSLVATFMLSLKGGAK